MTGGDSNVFSMILRSRIFKVFLIVGLSFMFTAVYINFFQHPPADVLLAMNSHGPSNFGPPRNFGGSGHNKVRSHHKVSRYSNEDEEEEEKPVGMGSEEEAGGSDVKFEDFWKKFLSKNNYVAIGAVYDRCENWLVQYGTVIMLPDKELGGVTSRTFVNLTLDKEIDGGQFNIEVKYNGKDLYDNYWEICELDEELPPENRTFNCPVAAGHHTKVKDRHIPNYLPKGRYQTKAWAKDEDDKVFACGFSDFTI